MKTKINMIAIIIPIDTWFVLRKKSSNFANMDGIPSYRSWPLPTLSGLYGQIFLYDRQGDWPCPTEITSVRRLLASSDSRFKFFSTCALSFTRLLQAAPAWCSEWGCAFRTLKLHKSSYMSIFQQPSSYAMLQKNLDTCRQKACCIGEIMYFSP